MARKMLCLQRRSYAYVLTTKPTLLKIHCSSWREQRNTPQRMPTVVPFTGAMALLESSIVGELKLESSLIEKQSLDIFHIILDLSCQYEIK
ncbi:hypothetical protein [Microvirga guangxiensis]|uniref:hypothetical protein n=1 Tax=Microvirga guangxiensis TaxID=549386 RepID=UPI001AECBDB7|nr:hypothetical protein [Microvirga guangxiensis]